MTEKTYNRRQTRERLNRTKYGYFQLIDQGILAAPLRLSENSHPFHTESQIRSAEKRLFDLANPAPKPRKSKPLSDRIYNEIQANAGR